MKYLNSIIFIVFFCSIHLIELQAAQDKEIIMLPRRLHQNHKTFSPTASAFTTANTTQHKKPAPKAYVSFDLDHADSDKKKSATYCVTITFVQDIISKAHIPARYDNNDAHNCADNGPDEFSEEA